MDDREQAERFIMRCCAIDPQGAHAYLVGFLAAATHGTDDRALAETARGLISGPSKARGADERAHHPFVDSFMFGTSHMGKCKDCSWEGPGRELKSTALQDCQDHIAEAA